MTATSTTPPGAGAGGTGPSAGATGPSAAATGPSGAVSLRLAARSPFDPVPLLGFLGARAVAGVEHWDGTSYVRALRLPGGPAIVELRAASNADGPGRPAAAGEVECVVRLSSAGDLQGAVQRCRQLLDLDADPGAIDPALGADTLLAPLVARRPGLRSPGAVDGPELLVRAILGQQVSVAGARTLAAGLAAGLGEPLPDSLGPAPVSRLFPSAAAIASVDPETLRMPAARRRALIGACAAVDAGRLSIGPGADRATLRQQLVALPGVGAWTADYVLMRAAGDPDVLLPTDLGVRRALERLGRPSAPRDAAAAGERWRPWRSYALHHLWASLADPPPVAAVQVATAT